MPFTPFHWGPVLIIGYFAYRYLNLPTLLVAAVAVDFRATLVFFGVLDGAIHGIFHTFIGATLIGILIALVFRLFRGQIGTLMQNLGLPEQEYTWSSIFVAAMVGTYSHIVLDAILYDYLMPFYPYGDNPFYGVLASFEVYLLCTLAGVIGVLLFYKKMNLGTFKENFL